MEQALEEKLEQDKEIIQAVTQQEMRKALLRNKLAAMRNSRGRITKETQLTDAAGNPIRGQRKFQEFYVTEKQVTRKVMQRLQFPKEELQRIEAEEEAERAAAEKAANAEQGAEAAEPADAVDAPPSADDDEDACVMVGDDDDEPIAPQRLAALAKPRIAPLGTVRPVTVAPPAAPPAPAPAAAAAAQSRAPKLDDIDRALAEIAREEKTRSGARRGTGKKISAPRRKPAHVRK